MNIKIKKFPIIERNPILQGDFCCEEMEQAVTGEFIGLENEEENIYPVIFKVTVTNKSPQGVLWNSMRIKFCPFCGKKINLKVEGGDNARIQMPILW